MGSKGTPPNPRPSAPPLTTNTDKSKLTVTVIIEVTKDRVFSNCVHIDAECEPYALELSKSFLLCLARADSDLRNASTPSNEKGINAMGSETKTGQQLWAVGENLNHDDDESTTKWQILGVFDDEQLAVAACTTGEHFVGPMTLNECLPDEPKPWAGGYYPRLEKKPEVVA